MSLAERTAPSVRRVRPARVAMLAGARFPIIEPFAGGLEAHTWTLAREHHKAGTPVTLYALAGSDARFTCRDLATVDQDSPLARAGLQGGTESDQVEHYAYLKAMIDLAEQPDLFDLVHNNGVHHLPVVLAASLPIPMVTALHIPPTTEMEAVIQLRGPNRVGTFVAISQFTADAWRPLLGPMTVIANGIDLDRWVPGPGGNHAVWTGRIVPEKAPHLAIDAARLAGMRIRLAGPVHDRSYWRREVAPRLDEGATWVGHLDSKQLQAFVGAARLSVVTPEWDEPFGLVVLEALASGTPVAAFGRGGIPEIVDASCGRLAPAGDVPALADAMVQASALDRSAARRRAESIGCARRMAASYRELYRHVLA
ncbi:MAG: glycosyltransferase [Acidimicrobiales bacterium]